MKKRPTTSTKRLLAAMLGAKRHKYGAKRTTVDGKAFASAREARRYSELRTLERAGKIRELQLQVRYPLVQKVVYVADFTYLDEHGAKVVEDVKGYRTRVYLQKRRMMLEQHGIRIREA